MVHKSDWRKSPWSYIRINPVITSVDNTLSGQYFGNQPPYYIHACYIVNAHLNAYRSSSSSWPVKQLEVPGRALLKATTPWQPWCLVMPSFEIWSSMCTECICRSELFNVQRKKQISSILICTHIYVPLGIPDTAGIMHLLHLCHNLHKKDTHIMSSLANHTTWM